MISLNVIIFFGDKKGLRSENFRNPVLDSGLSVYDKYPDPMGNVQQLDLDLEFCTLYKKTRIWHSDPEPVQEEPKKIV